MKKKKQEIEQQETESLKKEIKTYTNTQTFVLVVLILVLLTVISFLVFSIYDLCVQKLIIPTSETTKSEVFHRKKYSFPSFIRIGVLYF